MTQDEIIRMAREAANNEPIYGRKEFTFSRNELERFAALVAAHEREACAKVCDKYAEESSNPMNFAENCAAAIRARGNNK